uniref:Uncharacterized protein n=1 Tax=Cannabis sativa TaxID=3483 RepID=A0A803QFN0_CANSA
MPEMQQSSLTWRDFSRTDHLHLNSTTALSTQARDPQIPYQTIHPPLHGRRRPTRDKSHHVPRISVQKPLGRKGSMGVKQGGLVWVRISLGPMVRHGSDGHVGLTGASR